MTKEEANFFYNELKSMHKHNKDFDYHIDNIEPERTSVRFKCFNVLIVKLLKEDKTIWQIWDGLHIKNFESESISELLGMYKKLYEKGTYDELRFAYFFKR